MFFALPALGCAEERSVWPAWPADDASARALLDARARRAGAPQPPLDAARVLRALDRATERGTLRAGWGPIAAELRRHRVLVVGVHHDAAEHVRAFARLVGPAGTADRRLLALELFDADGRWAGIDASEQRGDGAELAALRGGVTRESLARVRRRLAEGAYTAWKYDYLDESIELAVLARGAEQNVIGCDVGPSLAARLGALHESLRLRVRELHCALALADARDPAQPVALFFGDAHAQPEGIARFLPEAPALVHLIGGRRSDAGIEPALAEHLALLDPLLVPLGARRFVLLLPDARMRASGDRSRVRLDVPERATRVTARSEQPAELWIDGAQLQLRDDDGLLPLAAGARAFVVRAGRMRIAGELALDGGGWAELSVDPSARRVDRVLASPSEAPPGSI